MCLAIPGQVVEFLDAPQPDAPQPDALQPEAPQPDALQPEAPQPDAPRHLATVEVSGVRRKVNVALLDDLAVGDWVLIHVGFAMSKISAAEAEEQMRLLTVMGESMEAVDEVKGYAF